ncbi:MAG: HEAT repeat domain-containing protein [Candidatus Hydrogenedentes bacterium]|nr:HEAT repeat domain-containing protein [Candidatus Hydrogenedentota bacterium]
MNTETKKWTDEAETYLRGYLQQVEALLAGQGADKTEVVQDLEAHILQMADAQTGALVTVPDVKRMLGTLGSPEDVATAHSDLGNAPASEDPWAAPYLNIPPSSPEKEIPWKWLGISAALLTGVALLTLPIWAYFLARQTRPFDSGDKPAPTSRITTDLAVYPHEVFRGWAVGGTAQEQYEVGTERNHPQFARDVMYMRSTAATPTGFVNIMRTVPAGSYRGYPVSLQTTLSTDETTGWAGLWLRIDDAEHQVLRFDNMQDRPVTGTHAAERYRITMDVPPEAHELTYGVLLDGRGEIRFEEPKLTVAGNNEANAAPAGMYSERFILDHATSYFFTRMAEPEEGYHQFAGLHAIQLKASWARGSDREQIIARALEIAQDRTAPFQQRFQCCYVVAMFEDERIIPYLETILRTDTNPTLRKVAATSLGHFEMDEAKEALKRTAPYEPDPAVQTVIQQAVNGEFPRPSLPKPGSGPQR